MANFKADANSTKLWLKLEGLESAFVVFREPLKNVRSIVGARDDRQLYLNEDNTVDVEVGSDSISEITWSDGKISKFSKITLPEPVNLNTDWNVDFLADHDFEVTRKFSELCDWKDSDEDAIKYYSGTAIYKKNFSMSIAKKDKLRHLA